MIRIRRMILGLVAAGLSALLVLVLSYAGASSEGPLSDALGWIATSVAQAERGAVRWIRGNDRAAELPWLVGYIEDPATLRNPRIPLIGVFDEAIPGSLEGALELERQLGTTFSFIQLYSAWGDRPDQAFPSRVAEAIVDLGSIPVITWEPWLVDFENAAHPQLRLRDDRDEHGLGDVAAGVYDFYVDEWAEQAKQNQEEIQYFMHQLLDALENNPPDSDE